MSNQYNILFETKTLYGLALHIDTAIIQTSKKQGLSPKEKNDFIQQFPYCELNIWAVNSL